MIAIIVILLLFCLTYIFIQDYRHRAVSWFLFPIAALSLTFLNFSDVSWQQMIATQITNLSFLGIQLLIVWFFFRLQNISSQDILNSKIGLGDLLFFLVLALGLPTYIFVLFFVGSLIVSLASGLLWFSKSTVPLAGLQSGMLIPLIILDFLDVINMSAFKLSTFI